MRVAHAADIPEAGVRLPQVFSVGFVGEPGAGDVAAIERLLAKQNAIPHRTLYAVMTIACPADLLSAEICLGLSIPVQVLLGSSREQLREDFDAGERERAEQVMQRALGVEVVSGEGSAAERAYECGIEVVRQSELVVLLGESEEIAEFARATGRRVLRLGESGEIESRRDTELGFLNGLPAAGVEAKDDSPKELASAWLKKLGANAGAVAPKVRRLAAVPILCTALAAIVSGAAPRLHLKLLWTGLGTVLGLTAALLPAGLRLARRQALWVRIRTAAEVTRSMLAVWDAPMRYEVVGPEVLPELAGMVLSLNLLKTHTNKASSCDVEQFKQRYREQRILDQMRYFATQAKQAAARGRRYRLLSKVCSRVAILLSALSFAGHLWVKTSGTFLSGVWAALLTSALFQAATVAGALLVVHDCDRRERRYDELHRSLQALDVELRAFRTWPLVNRVVNKIERALLVELIEWRSLLQNLKMPRN